MPQHLLLDDKGKGLTISKPKSILIPNYSKHAESYSDREKESRKNLEIAGDGGSGAAAGGGGRIFDNGDHRLKSILKKII
ncbi:tRNA-dihydrouridin [Sesbania bispinosa]|nr:tRNA-dihydrouridin [Sesbania bispinosa]